MKFAQRTKAMFQTVFSGSVQEYQDLLGFLSYIYSEQAASKIENHPQFAPSSLWRQWTRESFIGFSSELLLFQGGHSFPSAVHVGIEQQMSPSETQGIPGLLSQVYWVLMKGRDASSLPSFDTLYSKFKKYYPDWDILPQHREWALTHYAVYLRTLEAFALAELETAPKSMLEIGAGACVNVAFYTTRYPGLKSTVIDLPEMILSGYIFLKTVSPDLKICLPHQIRSSLPADTFDVVFLLPYQTDLIPDDNYDIAFNMSSFQEMPIETVNNYLGLIFHKLKPGGKAISVNQRVSRYIAGNTIDAYDFKLFGDQPGTRNPPFHNWLTRDVKGVEMVHTVVTKAGG